MRQTSLVGFIAMVLSCQASLVSAASVTLVPVDSGELFSDVFTGGVWEPGSGAYSHKEGLEQLSFNFYGGSALSGTSYDATSGYLIYDLSNVNFSVQSASLVFDLAINSSAGSPGSIVTDLLVNSVTSMTPQALSLMPTGDLTPVTGDTISADLSSGLWGWVSAPAGAGTYVADLNSDALASINAESGLLAVGLWAYPYGPDNFVIDIDSAPRLVLSDMPSTSPVPIPAAAWLFGSALMGLVGVARRKRV